VLFPKKKCQYTSNTSTETTSLKLIFGRPYRTAFCPVCLSVTLTYCGQTAGWIRTLLRTEVGLGPGDIVFDGDPAPPSRKVPQKPHFSVHVCCGQTAGWIKTPVGTKVGLGPGDIMLDGDRAPPSMERGTVAPHFLAHVYCGQTVARLSNC